MVSTAKHDTTTVCSNENDPHRFVVQNDLASDEQAGPAGREVWEGPFLACAVQRRRFPVGASPTRRPLQPEAIGAVMEATKWLKPSISVSRIGDSASVQAATQVNAEQASKRTMCGPTRLPYRGRLIRLGRMSEVYSQPLHRGIGGACTQGKRTQHGKPQGAVTVGNAGSNLGGAGCRFGDRNEGSPQRRRFDP
jgi:hypothetical protein